MDPERFVVIHTNPKMGHQVVTAQHVADGFKAHGYRTLITDDRSIMGGINVINGPNWAYREFLGEPNVLMIDRAFWGDPHYVQIGWLLPEGGRDYCGTMYPERVAATNAPKLQPRKKDGIVGMLADYGMRQIPEALADKVDEVRWHPMQVAGQGPLQDFIARCRKVVGWNSTALVPAMFAGCELQVLSKKSLLYGKIDRQWLATKMASNQWNLGEISQGLFWKHLQHGVTRAPDVRYARPET